MKALRIHLPDGSQREFEGPVTPQKVALSIGRRLEEAAIAARVDGKLVDLDHPLEDEAKLAIVTRDSKDGLEVLRHSTAHLLAQAIKELYPEAQITIGPVIEDGFFYDIDCPKQLTPEDLPLIEKRMETIAAQKLVVTHKMMPRDEAVSYFRNLKEEYKAEIIASIPEASVSLYTQGNFTDLCRGPHVPNTSKLGKFKLLSIAGAYWRGDEKNKMLQRIYGTAFATQKELDEYLHRIEEAKRRDHRKLGPELGLFTFLPVAPAMPFYLPKGTLLLNMLTDFMRREIKKAGYDEVVCPQLMSAELWKTSGHWENYRENMFTIDEDKDTALALKPMNCPGHCALFGSTHHSYKDLPLRLAEFSKLHRNERAGVTHGLLRTRAFCQDDAHIFCTEDQVESESVALVKQTFDIYKLFGFTEVIVRLATRPEKYLGTIETWDKAIEGLKKSLVAAGTPFEIAEGEGAFYGPKVEFHIKDSLGRFWQCGTIQLDYMLPERFQLEYIDGESQVQRPIMIHRAILGSLERFIGILVEHHAGHLPAWVSPLQVVVLNVTDAQADYARSVVTSLEEQGIRVRADLRNEKLGFKIREAQLQKVPVMVVLGNKELENKTISVRRTNGETANDLTLEEFRDYLEPLLNPGGTSH